uniref:Variant surface glycoprotein 823 n=1 Tax=Trypanosoma brucei TaxID=5691 RepID=M4SXD3_9TRYP|nr:variant surface glycoprotein 823 [Trypanosoma brucei]
MKAPIGPLLRRQALCLAVLAFQIVCFCDGVEGDEHENQPEFRALCHTLRLLQTGLPVPSDQQSTEITATMKWISLARDLAVANESTFTQILEEANPQPKRKLKKLQASANLLEILADINETHAEADQEVHTLAETLKAIKTSVETANGKFLKAVGGDNTPSEVDDGGTKYFAAGRQAYLFGAGATQTKNCGGASASYTGAENVGITLISDIVCLCISGASTDKKLCGATVTNMQASTIPWTSNPSTLATKWATLMSMCPKISGEVTTERIRMALNHFRSLIGNNVRAKTSAPEKTKFTLGHSSVGNTGCTGDDKQTCVNYAPLFEGAGPKDIPWRKTIETALDKVDKRQPETQTVLTNHRLLILNRTVWQTFMRESQQQQPSPAAKPTIPRKVTDTECTKNNKQDDCADPCKWNDKAEDPTKKCTLDPVKAAEQAPTQAEETAEGAAGAAKTGVNCSSHTTKETCEAVTCTPPSGKAKACVWIKGKCQDSSILVNKKLVEYRCCFCCFGTI